MSSYRISPTFVFWDRVRAGMVLTTERWIGIVYALFWPLLGIGLALFAWSRGQLLQTPIVLAVVLCLLFVPLMLLVGPASVHFGKHAKEPFTYTFDDDGIHVSAVTYEFTHKWPTVFKVKRRAGFLLFFFAPACAHCIPLRAIPDPQLQAALVALAATHGADTRKA